MVMESFSLEGKVAIVTGARRGIGQAMAAGLSEAGADIVGVATCEMKETMKIVNANGKRFFSYQADLNNLDTINKIVDYSINEAGKIDILVNNAGINRRQPFLQFSLKNWDDVMNINLRASYFLAQAVANYFVTNNIKGKIINIASMLSFQGGFNISSYCASKSAVLGITRAMCNELAPYNINVNAIAPGYIVSDMNEDLRKDYEINKSILERIPMNRWGKPSDIKGTVVFLASAASDYINGSVIAVDGGWLAR